jgi:Exostosin family
MSKALRPEASHGYRGHNGPWVEQMFYTRWSAAQHRQGERFYLPVFWADCYFMHKQQEVQAFLDSLSTHIKYYTVTNLDGGFDRLQLVMPKGVDLLLFAASGRGDAMPNAIPVPLLRRELTPSGLPKVLDVSYQVNMFTHPLRSKVAEALKGIALILPCWLSGWETVLDRSVFAVCPRGDGVTSFRMFEALQVHTIPIYVWEDVECLPYKELIDWDEFAIVVEAKDIAKLPDLIAAADVPKMLKKLASVSHMFTYDYTVQYILDRVSSDQCH